MELREVFAERQGFLYDVLRYHLGWTDEVGQPTDNPMALYLPTLLALVCCQALSGDFQASLPAAAGVDLVHNFTLVHGDVQSSRPNAQDRPSIWWVWGPAQAINAGDGLHALGRTTIMRLARNDIPPERVLHAVESLDRACLALCEGQYMDLAFQERMVVTSAAYFDMISRKTGALTGCAAEVGALAAGTDQSVWAQFREMGAKMGMAWQICQDIGDLWGASGDGMTASNVLNKKKSLPLIHALENSSLAAKRELGGIYMKRVLELDDASKLVDILNEAGSKEFSEGNARRLMDEATENLDGADLMDKGLDNLKALGQGVLDGRY
ncbi:MAG: hypothetical protein BZY75_01200 [SAR202 cluster bacterium Io17-Chloro-G7]|nr:MAG: hypothetical protein BZY75_01200 [SAR202 cluster bacterium Io17-Chloro-G7]